MNSTYCIFNKIRHFSSAILADDSLLCTIFFPYHAKYVDIFVVYYGESVERSVADTVQSWTEFSGSERITMWSAKGARQVITPSSRISLLTCYRPQTKLRKGIVFTSVCQEFCPQGGVPQCLLRYTPLLWAGTPPGQVPPLGRHPPGRHPRGQAPLLEADPYPWSRPPPQQTATAVDSTHPTGMHSCCQNILLTNCAYHLATQGPFALGNDNLLLAH